MSLQVSDLNLPADKLAQLASALGDGGGQNAALQGICNGVAADVNRLTAGYMVDAASVTNWGRTIALYRAYAQAQFGEIPKAIADDYKTTWDELTEISQGKRPNLPKVADPALASRAGAIGGAAHLSGRIHRPRDRAAAAGSSQATATTLSYIGSPTAGTWNTNDRVTDSLGAVWQCNAGGTPGLWTQVSPGTSDAFPTVGVPVNYLVQSPANRWAQFYFDGAAWQPVNLQPPE